ncbi:MAG: helix-turn-helix domain-containing protein, partial [Sulfitobacter sp.]|nr:helix-turn-helix domain-containing protein [Sulfitobacter sp.]
MPIADAAAGAQGGEPVSTAPARARGWLAGQVPGPAQRRSDPNGAGMSRHARDWAWGRQGLTPAQRLVLLALAEHADDHGESCFPSLGLLERMTELSRRGITKALNGLDGALIERDRGGPHRATRYRLLLSTQSDNQRSTEGGEPSALGNTVPEGRELSTLSVGNTVPPNRHKNRHRTVNEPLSYDDTRE